MLMSKIVLMISISRINNTGFSNLCVRFKLKLGETELIAVTADGKSARPESANSIVRGTK